MAVLVFGAGAVGTLFAGLFARAGRSVDLRCRPAQVGTISDRGVQIEGSVAGRFPVRAIGALPRPLRAELVILAVKSYDVEAAAREIGESLDASIPILLPQNGLGIEALARAGLRGSPELEEDLIRAVNTIPATWLAPGRVRYAGRGEIRLPAVEEPMRRRTAIAEFRALFEEAGIRVANVADLDAALYTKAIVNAVINPLTADRGVPNGALEGGDLRPIAEALFAEAIEAVRATGHRLDRASVEEELWRTVRATATNRSSMLQDVDRGRPTEIEAISGALLAVGHAAGVPMPATERIVARLRARPPRHGQGS